MAGSTLSLVDVVITEMETRSLGTEFLPMETSTGDSLDHAFCSICYPIGSDMIVSLCDKLRGDEPVGAPILSPCAICYSEGIACRSCGAVFN